MPKTITERFQSLRLLIEEDMRAEAAADVEAEQQYAALRADAHPPRKAYAQVRAYLPVEVQVDLDARVSAYADAWARYKKASSARRKDLLARHAKICKAWDALDDSGFASITDSECANWWRTFMRNEGMRRYSRRY